jgi:hypothetical protein
MPPLLYLGCWVISGSIALVFYEKLLLVSSIFIPAPIGESYFIPKVSLEL